MKKNKPNIIEGFRAVEFMRTVRDQISRETQGMSFAELTKYFEERRRKIHPFPAEVRGAVACRDLHT
jgi:hypothetical protein